MLLDAMSRPGRVVRLPFIDKSSAFAAALSVGRCLLDHEVTLCAIGDNNAPELQAALVERTLVRCAALEKADFVFIAGGNSRGNAKRVKRGSMESPEQGATLIYCLDAEPAEFTQSPRIRFSGPGIEESPMPFTAGFL